jgi:type IV pilus assembly protein PilM
MSAFGLDIGTTSIKAIQLEHQGEQFALQAAGITASPAIAMSSDNDKDLEAIAAIVKKLIADTKITSRQVNISLPESQVFTRLIELPLLTDEEVNSAISWQAEPYIPIPVQEASIDYQIVSRREAQANVPGAVQVLLVATAKTLVQRYLKMAEMAGLTVVSVESELLSLSRVLGVPNQTVLIADLGSNSSDFGIVRSGQLLVSRSVPTAGSVFTRALSSGLNVGVDRAEEYKKSYGLNSSYLEGKVQQSLEPVFKTLADEMKKTIQYYKSDIGREDQVTAALLAGGTSGMPEITPAVADALGVEVLVGDPFAKIIKDERTSKILASWAPLYGIAVGLAQNI